MRVSGLSCGFPGSHETLASAWSTQGQLSGQRGDRAGVFRRLKDKSYRGREFDSYEQFKCEPDAYIMHWNIRWRQIRLEGHAPEEFQSMSLVA